MSDLVGNPEDRFSHDAAHLISPCPVMVIIKIMPNYKGHKLYVKSRFAHSRNKITKTILYFRKKVVGETNIL